MKRSDIRHAPAGRGPLGAGLARLHTLFAEDVWSPGIAGRAWPVRALCRLARVSYLALHGFRADRCMVRASALTYTTLLSLVPALAFACSLAKGVGAWDELRTGVIDEFLESNLPILPGEAGEASTSPESIVQLRAAIDEVLEFVSETNFRSLGAVTLMILAYAVIKLLSTVEGTLNDIWRVHKARSLVRKLSDYISLSVISPVLLVVAMAISTASEGNALAVYLESSFLAPLVALVLELGPFLAVWLGFAFVYLIMPNTRTRIVSSVIGGVVGGCLWQLAQIGHLEFQLGMASFNPIYAGFAAFPIFMVWIHLSWVTVMVGAEFAYAHQNEPAYRRLAQARTEDHAVREILAVRAMARIARAFVRGEQSPTTLHLAGELELPVGALDEILMALVDAEILVEAGDAPETAYLLARELDSITVKAVIDSQKGRTRPADMPTRGEIDARVAVILAELDEVVDRSGANISMREVVAGSTGSG